MKAAGGGKASPAGRLGVSGSATGRVPDRIAAATWKSEAAANVGRAPGGVGGELLLGVSSTTVASAVAGAVIPD
ncbi:hypothetical protein NI18_05685 [Sphingomonas sp. Ant20]|nr:hypothetical protein NI18_05685 [Sphingomonas sp. Ant20]